MERPGKLDDTDYRAWRNYAEALEAENAKLKRIIDNHIQVIKDAKSCETENAKLKEAIEFAEQVKDDLAGQIADLLLKYEPENAQDMLQFLKEFESLID